MDNGCDVENLLLEIFVISDKVKVVLNKVLFLCDGFGCKILGSVLLFFRDKIFIIVDFLELWFVCILWFLFYEIEWK